MQESFTGTLYIFLAAIFYFITNSSFSIRGLLKKVQRKSCFFLLQKLILVFQVILGTSLFPQLSPPTSQQNYTLMNIKV